MIGAAAPVPDTPENVSSELYLGAIIFETVLFIVSLYFTVLAMRKYTIRRTKANIYMIGICVSFSSALILTIIAKSLVLFFFYPYETGTIVEKFALLSTISANAFFVLFSLEVFKDFSKRRNNIIIGIYLSAYLPVVVSTMINIRQGTNFIFYALHLLLAFITFIFLMKNAYQLMKKASGKLESTGMLLIFLAGLGIFLFYAFTMMSGILIDLGVLTPFNILYFLSWGCLVMAFFMFYNGFFLPDWVRKRFGN
mgnify:CR=1 FL=1